MLVGRTVYGEAQPDPGGEQPARKGLPDYSIRRASSPATSTTSRATCCSSRRQLAADYKNTLDWSESPSPLKAETFTSSTAYDALNRPIELIAPHSDQPGAKVNVIQPGLQRGQPAGRRMRWLNLHGRSRYVPCVTAIDYICRGANVDYDAKGQRTRIEYGNGVTHAPTPTTR